MSDRILTVRLPKTPEQYSSNIVDLDWVYHPDCNGLELLGELCCSGIATRFSLYVWKHVASGIVFWMEWEHDDPPHFDLSKEHNDIHGAYELFRDNLDQFCSYLQCWTPKWRSTFTGPTEVAELQMKLYKEVTRTTANYYIYARDK